MVSLNDQTLQIRASAAAWLARLRSEQRTSQDLAAFQEWLAADPAHAAAFEMMNSVWDAAGPLRRDLRGRIPSAERGMSRRAIFGGVAIAAGLGGTLLLTESVQATVYQTEIGEQKHVLLRDGSQIFLDTNTRLTVAFDKANRKAALEFGCANFRLAADASRPFSVNVGENRMLCDHSTFDVRRDGDMVSILLLQGRATVDSGRPGAASERVLKGGERLVSSKESVTLDKPDLLPLLAWQTGQAIFRDETLVQAAREMNRYSKMRLEIADPRVSGLKVSGVYRVGDNLMFALALVTLLPVQIRPVGDHIEIISNEKKAQKI